MGQIIPYLLRVNIAVAILYSLYWLLIRNKSNFKLNRMYLLSVLLFAFLFPLISFPVEIEEFVNTNQFNFINTVNDFTSFSNTVAIKTKTPETPVDMQLILSYAYLLITFLLLLRFIIELIRIIKKIVAYDKIKKERFTLIVNQNFKSPFSFFHYIFVEKSPGVDSLIIEHEKVHVRQLHTLDLFFAQISSALLWINPFMYLLKKELVALHEYLADFAVLNNGENHEKYLNQVLNQVQNNFNSGLLSKFNYSLTKKRLKMMKSINLNKKRPFKYFILFIATGIIAGLFACSNMEDVSIKKKYDTIPFGLKTPDGQRFSFPISRGNIKSTSLYFNEFDSITKRKVPDGLYIIATEGTEILAPFNGVVRKVGHNREYGKYIIIDSNNLYSVLFSIISTIKVKAGDKVKRGTVICHVGNLKSSTTPNFHLDVRKTDEMIIKE